MEAGRQEAPRLPIDYFIVRLPKIRRNTPFVSFNQAAELKGMRPLHEIGRSFLSGGELQPILEKVLDAAIPFTKTDMGNIQFFHPDSGNLKIRLQRGFPKDWFDHWDVVDETKGSCGAQERGARDRRGRRKEFHLFRIPGNGSAVIDITKIIRYGCRPRDSESAPPGIGRAQPFAQPNWSATGRMGQSMTPTLP
jgi:hypothetical protein